MDKVFICGINTQSIPKISAKECEELLKRVKKGDAYAKEKLITANMRLVLSLIKKFTKTPQIDADDLFQAGMVGLIKAVDNFDDKFSVKFSTYAVPMILV